MMKAAQTNSPLLIVAQIVQNSTSSPDDVVAAGQKALGANYSGSETDSINTLRYRTFINKVAQNTVSVKAQSLPPSAAATKLHSLRVYFQVQMWRGNTSINPCEWGWQLKDGQLHSTYTDLPPARPCLLAVIRFNCKIDCDMLRCSCRKNVLRCTSACGECCSKAFTNSTVMKPVTDGDDKRDVGSDTD